MGDALRGEAPRERLVERGVGLPFEMEQVDVMPLGRVEEPLRDDARPPVDGVEPRRERRGDQEPQAPRRAWPRRVLAGHDAAIFRDADDGTG